MIRHSAPTPQKPELASNASGFLLAIAKELAEEPEFFDILMPMKSQPGWRQSLLLSGFGNPSRRKVIQSIAIGLSTLNPSGAAADSSSVGKMNPGRSWERFPAPEAAGFRSAGLNTLEQTLFTKPTTSLLIVKGGKIVYSYGDTSHVSYLASARKSVLSMLYGNYVA